MTNAMLAWTAAGIAKCHACGDYNAMLAWTFACLLSIVQKYEKMCKNILTKVKQSDIIPTVR